MTAASSDSRIKSILLPLDPWFAETVHDVARNHGMTPANLVHRIGVLLMACYGQPDEGALVAPDAETTGHDWLAKPTGDAARRDHGMGGPVTDRITAMLDEDSCAIRIDYVADAFDADAAARMAGHFENLLRSLVAEPAAPIGTLEILTDSERAQVLVDWNGTATEYPADALVHHLIARQASLTPQATAIVAGEDLLSYQELDQRTNQLAHHLRNLGVGPGSLVAICVQRDAQMLVGMLGVLKAGGAYVPLDPDNPPDRLAFILKDTQAITVVTQENLTDRLPSEGPRILCLDSDWPAIAGLPASAPAPEAGPDDLAYVIYTSGSTGEPKGVQVTHRNFADFMHSADADFPPTGRGHGSVLLSSVAFDLPIPSLFLPLLQGESVVIMREPGAAGVALLAAAFVRGESFSTVKLTPSHLELLLEGLEGTDARLSVGTLVVAGEPFGADLARAALERCAPGAVVFNEYGPTETTVGATLYKVDPAKLVPGTTLPIGCPMANTEAYVVDRYGRPAPIGATGELWIGGAGVARGYLGRPELTARSFLPHPFSDDPDARVYRTGDLARWLPDGNLEFLGRSDHQLKIRGHRVELGEIDAAITSYPGVAQAVTVVREDQPGDQRLVSYVVCDGPTAAARHARDGAAHEQHISAWGAYYEAKYAASAEEFSGWASSYDGCPLPSAEMRRWREATVEAVLAHRPRRVLELGVGDGALLSVIAPHCTEYWGTDLSPTAVERLTELVARDPALASRVTLRSLPAHVSEGLPDGAFDMVLLNSVVQYFPGVDYLLQVLARAMDLLADDGTLFIGDVRNLQLLHCFHTAAQAQRAHGEQGAATLRTLSEHSAQLEKELLLAPEFFAALHGVLPGIGAVRVHVKRGDYDNELSRYRYDVTIRKGPARRDDEETRRWDWGDVGGLVELKRLLAESGEPARAVGVPNRRLGRDLAVRRAVERGDSAAVRDAVAGRANDEQAPDIEKLFRLGEGLGHQVVVTWSGDDDGSLDVVFADPAERGGVVGSRMAAAPEDGTRMPARYANAPVIAGGEAELRVALRRHVAERLPEHMVPNAFVVLERLPLSANGKVDRQALPKPSGLRAEFDGRYVAPRTPTEDRIAQIWADVLAVDRVGIHDDFFELGGHSLLVMRVVNLIKSELRLDLTIGDLFACPSVAALAERADGLADFVGPALEPRGCKDREAPLSFGQQRLWFLHRLTPDSGQLLTHRVVRLRGAVDVPALDAAFTGLLERHEVLRTRIVRGEDGEPRQQIVPPGKFRVERRDAAGRDEALVLAREEARRPLDPEDGSPLRVVLVREAADAHLLLVALHHIVTDDWSVQVLAKELGELYAAAFTGREPELPLLPVQYADFAVWEREQLQGEHLERQLGYWRTQLEGLEPLELPTDRLRPPQRTGNGASVEFAVPNAVARGLSELARRASVTPFMVQLATFQLFLGKYSGQDDLAVGVPTAGRNWTEIEGLIGFFVNTLVMRADLSGDPTFEEFLGRVRESAHGAYAHQDVPFERLVEDLAPDRNLSRTPLFQAMLTPQNLSDEVWDFPGLHSEALRTGMDGAQFDLTLVLQESPDTFRGLLSYSTDIFDRTTAERMARHFQNLLAQAVETPTARLSELEMLSEADRHQLLVEWNDTSHEMPTESVPALFERQVARTPDAPALTYEDVELTYRELNARANRIAHLLITSGVGPGHVVGLAVPKSDDLIVTLLGIAKTGAAYLPIDVEYPADRIAYMIEDAQPTCVLTHGAVEASFPSGAQRIDLDDPEWVSTLGSMPATDPTDAERLAPVTQDTAFYVMYTSGSTGRPKGVVMPGKGLVNLTSWVRAATPGEPDGRVAQFATISFDVAPYEILSALLYGKCLVVAPEHVRLDPVSLVKWLKKYEIHELNAPNLVLEEFYKAANTSDAVLHKLQAIIQGGDTHLLGESARAFHARHPWCRLHNGYGPTETHGVTYHELPTDVTQWPAVAPIGGPVGNTHLYVLDRNRRLVPVGTPGELYAGGVGVAHGYLRNPELTGERFLPDPFGSPRARMYRTGDLVRWLPDGTLEFLGRIDQQIKVRGIRIELGEIESTLMKHEHVVSCVVVAREDRPGDKRLVAYCVTREAALEAALWEWCMRSLPEYMVPSAFVLLDRLPLTANKKVDRAALPAPQALWTQPDEAYVAPSTLEQELVARVWADVLGVDRVGAHDNFFELGGHSLLAMRAVNGIASTANVEVPVRELFAHPTVAGFADRVAAVADGARSIPLVPRDTGCEFPLSFGQQRLWFLDQLLTDSAESLLPVAVRLRGNVDVRGLEKAFAALVERHEVLRSRFVVEACGEPRQVVDVPGEFHLEVLDGGPDPLSVVRAEAFQPMDLAVGPLMRAVVVRVAEGEHLLLVVMHHIVSDGWSMRLVSEELPLLYTAAVEGRSADLEALTVQYGDFAVWQRSRLEDWALERQLDYWREALTGLEPLELPTDRPRPPVRSGRGASVEFEVPGAVLEGLRELARREQCTLFMVVLGLFQVLLGRYSGQTDVAVGVPIAGRNRAEVEGLVGFFVNTLVMRADLAGDPSVRDLLAQVRDRAVDAYSNQDVPFERLVEELAPDRDLSRTPLFQVMLAPQESREGQWDFKSLHATPIRLDAASCAYDMSMSFREEADRLMARVEYSTDLFDPATIERLTGHFGVLLASAVADPDARIGELEILTNAEHHELLVEWNNTAVPYPVELAVPVLFEQRVRECPDAVAVVCGDQALSYKELNARANRLAQRLRSLGVGRNALVGVCLERGADLVVGLLGVLKAGGAYVPLDPEYPQERLAFMLDDTAAGVVVTQESLRKQLPHSGAVLVSLDGDAASLAGESAEDLEAEGAANDLAYVIYTSGSTGVPKGVGVPRMALTNVLLALRDRLSITDQDRLLSVTTIMFDISNLELYLPLVTGAQVVIANKEQARDPSELTALLTEHRVTVMQATPSVWQMLVDVLPDDCANLHILTGGEALPLDLAKRLSQRAERVTNLYGPTETTIWSLAADVPPCVEAVTIGSPLANTELLVMDRNGRLTPVGVPGELWIGGIGVARGYLNRPELTAERFVAHPFSPDPTARVYRTGDLVRRRPDGTIEYLRRMDHQVKVRGHRIELGEVESALLCHEAVDSAVAVVREDSSGRKRLVAYCVAAAEAAQPSVTALRAICARSLPEYMVPSAFVYLDALPLTANKKVDRKALPALEGARLALEERYVAPRTTIEKLVAHLWADVLGVDRIGVHDNFFELGGDSILSIQVLNRARRYGLKLTAPMMFQYSTVEQLAGRAAQELAEQEPMFGEVPLSPHQRHLLANGLETDSRSTSSRRIADCALDPRLLERALAAVVNHHDALRLTFEYGDQGWRQVCAETAEPVLRIHDLSGETDEASLAAMEVAARELWTSPDLSGGPLFRCALFELGGGLGQRLLLSAHRLVVDDASWRIVLEDLDTAYAALSAGQDILLPMKTTSFKTWAGRIEAYARSAAGADEMGHWTYASRHAPIPFDREGANSPDSPAVVTACLGAQETDALACRATGKWQNGMAEVVLAALAHGTQGWVPGLLWAELDASGREHPFGDMDLSRTVGCFVTAFPFELPTLSGAGARTALAATRERLAATPGSGFTYGALSSSGPENMREALAASPQIRLTVVEPVEEAPTRLGKTVKHGETAARTADTGGARQHLIHVIAELLDGRLSLDLEYSRETHDRGAIEELANRVMDFLADLSTDEAGNSRDSVSVESFPLADLDQAGLASILERFSK
ncbi:amino acid adenylation domain-containing protein [Streptomyces sioyaensis]|uniref:amino acid adenylation domain-containing protein n=1 Tax=Streptomyces sioyaensis TaxID=67364 RepID=UPI0037CF3921